MRDQVGSDRRCRRHAESPGNSEQHHHGKHRPDDLEPSVGEDQQQHRAQHFGGVTERQDQAPVEAIGDLPGNQDQRQERHELREPYEAQVQRIVRDRVDLPSHGDALHLHGERGKETGEKETREIRIAEHPQRLSTCSAHGHRDRWCNFILRLSQIGACTTLRPGASHNGPRVCWPRSRSEVLKNHERRSRTHRRAPFPPDRPLAAAAHAAQARRAGAASLGSARDARRRRIPGARCGTSYYGDPLEFQERHYKEFVTFLPYVQRFLYGSSVGQEASQRHGEPSIRVFRRADVARVRVTYDDGAAIDLRGRARRSLFLPRRRHRDARVRDARQRHHRSIGRRTRCSASAAHIPRSGNAAARAATVRGASSGWAQTAKCWRPRTTSSSRNTSAHVGRYRAPCDRRALGVPAEAARCSSIRARPGRCATASSSTTACRSWPTSSFDDPTRALARAISCASACVTRPGERDSLPYSDQARSSRFEAEYCDDRFWGRAGGSVLGRHAPHLHRAAARRRRPAGRLFLHRPRNRHVRPVPAPVFPAVPDRALSHSAALLSMSDELAVAMNRLEVGDLESVRQFKRAIRSSMEIFLRFTHRYWFHEVSNQEIARSIFDRLTSAARHRRRSTRKSAPKWRT